MHFLYLAGLFISSVLGAQLPGINVFSQISQDDKVTCRAVKYLPDGNNATITAHLKKISSSDAKIPLLIFRYSQIEEFNGIPPWEVFNHRQEEFADKIIGSDGGFLAEPISDDFNAEFGKFQLSDSDEVVFNVKESGIYCAYAFQPKGVDSFSLRIDARNSYGYLQFPMYILYKQGIYFTILASLLAGGLIHYILRFKVGEDFKNLNSISIISKAMIFYVLSPMILIAILQSLGSLIANHISLVDSNSLILFVPTWLSLSFAIVIRFFTLLFAMGYGVIYCHEEDSAKYRKIPVTLWKRATTFFAVDFLSFAAYCLLTKLTNNTLFGMDENMFDPSSSNSSNIVSVLLMVFQLITSVFPLIWFIFSMIHYFRTKTSITKFPVTANPEDNSKLLSAFRKSFVLIFVLPLATSLAIGVITGMKFAAASGGSDIFPAPPELSGHPDIDRLSMQLYGVKVAEMIYFDSLFITSMAWSSYVNVFLTVAAVFAIWSKNNYGIVIDKEQEFYSQVNNQDEFDNHL